MSYLLGEVTRFLWEDEADAVEAFHGDRKRAGRSDVMRKRSFETEGRDGFEGEPKQEGEGMGEGRGGEAAAAVV